MVDNPNSKGGRSIVAEITYPDFKSSSLEASEQNALMLGLKNATTKEEADLVLSKATKPISYKTKVVHLTEKDASKYTYGIGAKNVSDMADKAKVGETSTEANTQSKPTMIMVTMPNGQSGQIPSDKIDAFMEKYPNAKRQ